MCKYKNHYIGQKISQKSQYINFQKWFQKYNTKNSKYIKNIEVWSLRTPDLKHWTSTRV